MKMTKAIQASAVAIALSACANLNTIDRTTTVAINANEDTGRATAIHLDAEQRIVMVHSKGWYCAEPSPDLGSATSAGGGAGASINSQGAGSVAAAQQESIASLSARTQSTQLQRELMYRICESYYNGATTQSQNVTLLSRAQDLTAVILAVEQLTGAVAAGQFALLGSANASSSAALVSNQANLEIAKDFEQKDKERLDAANTAVSNKESELSSAQDQLSQTTASLAAAQNASPPDQSEISRQTSLKGQQQDSVTKIDGELDSLKSDASQSNKSYERSKKLREAIESQLDSALTTASASASGSAQFSPIVQRRELSLEATKEIAESVEAMVKAVLGKNYIIETCLGVLERPLGSNTNVASQIRYIPAAAPAAASAATTIAFCERLLFEVAMRQNLL